MSVLRNGPHFEDLKMPDEDRFQRSIPSAWRKVFRLSKGGIASEAELGDACSTALAHSLRQGGGCPGLQEIGNVLQDFARGWENLPMLSPAGGSTLIEGFEALRQIERAQGGHRTTKVAVRAARTILVQLCRQADPHISEAQLGQLLSERTCIELVDHHFFGRARAYLVGERFSTPGEAKAWEQAVKKAMTIAIQKLANRLWQDPSAARLRAPKRTVARRSTQDLLNDPLT
jgi:hypothetical protein